MIQRVIDNSEGETGAQSIKSSVFFCNSCFTVREMKLCMSALASVLHFLNIISPAVLILPRIVHACCCTFSDKISPVVVILPPWIILILWAFDFPVFYQDALIYWSSSRCLPHRDKVAKDFLSLVPHHSFGRCLNNVGGPDMALSMYPVCSTNDNGAPHWWDHLHCAMSHYKFVLAIENTKTESYVTEKLFYALEAGSVPIYFGAPNVWDFVPPNSIIDASKFSSLKELASYVKALANDPVAYAEYHAWRRCGVLGNFGRAREMSLDTLPCRLCELVSKRGARVQMHCDCQVSFLAYVYLGWELNDLQLICDMPMLCQSAHAIQFKRCSQYLGEDHIVRRK